MLAASALFCALGIGVPARAACDDAPRGPSLADHKRSVTLRDLVTLADIGSPDPSAFTGPSPLSLSPDGHQVAFVVARGDPDTNRVCQLLIMVALDGRTKALELNSGGDLILATGAYRGSRVVTGMPATIVPRWSPDGRRLAWLRRDQGATRIWLANLSDRSASPLTPAGVDVERFAWACDGRQIIFATHKTADDAQEMRNGFHYDDRFVPTRGALPQPPAETTEEIWAAPVEGGDPVRFDVPERQLIDPPADEPGGLVSDPNQPLHPPHLWGRDASGIKIECSSETCAGPVIGIFPNLVGQELHYLRREGWAREITAMYRWRIAPGAVPQRLWQTTRVLNGCVQAGKQLVCLAEDSTTPRRVAVIDPASGGSRNVFDPNPDFAAISLDKVVRLRWRNNRSLEAWGDLLVPRGTPPRSGWPLVVVQYHSQGFLRGGTGDEYPIFAMAARGYAVLSLEQPPIVATIAKGIRSFEAANGFDTRDWAERRSLLSSIETGLAITRANVPIDPARIAITGLSDGATSAAFALLNTHLFAAAAVSTCCMDPWSAMIAGGPAYAAYMRRLGYPASIDPDPGFWAPMSLAQGARKVRAPILMQLADDEALLGLQSYTALREAGQPVDLYVYPDEHHVKWQPAHRLAIYTRNLDWFDFWLLGKVDPDASKVSQYRHWERLRRCARLSALEPTPQHLRDASTGDGHDRVGGQSSECTGQSNPDRSNLPN